MVDPSRRASRDHQVKFVCKYPVGIKCGVTASSATRTPGNATGATQKKNYKVSLLTTDPSSSYKNDAADSSSDVSPSS